jgi:hypothetical protein
LLDLAWTGGRIAKVDGSGVLGRREFDR